MIAIAYAAFVGLVAKPPRKGHSTLENRQVRKAITRPQRPQLPAGLPGRGPRSAGGTDRLSRWRPLAVMLCAILFSVRRGCLSDSGNPARATRSIRSRLTFDLFAFGSLPALDAVKAAALPLYYHLEACGYVAPLF